MFRRSLIVALLALAGAFAAPTLTTIQDVLYNADGSRFNGILTISWATFQTGGGQTPILGNTKTYRIVNGNLYVQLTPTTGATPAAEYLVTYYSSASAQYQEVWNVPSSAQSLAVAAVRAASTDILTDTASRNPRSLAWSPTWPRARPRAPGLFLRARWSWTAEGFWRPRPGTPAIACTWTDRRGRAEAGERRRTLSMPNCRRAPWMESTRASR